MLMHMLQKSWAIVDISKVVKLAFATVIIFTCYSIIATFAPRSNGNEKFDNIMQISSDWPKNSKFDQPIQLSANLSNHRTKAFLDLLNLPISKLLNVPGSYNSPIMIPSQKVLLCWIPKNSCTQLKAISCRASLPKNASMHEAINKNLGIVHASGCQGVFAKFWKLNATEKTKVLTNKSWRRLAVLRNPFDKFVSGWINKCSINGADYKRNKDDCYKCNASLECFIMKNYHYVQELSKYGKSIIPAIKHFDHFTPQYWFCDFPHHLEDYQLIKYDHSEDFKTKFREQLEKEFGFPHWLIHSGWGENMSSPFLASKTKHVSEDKAVINAKKLIEENTPLADYLFRTYFIDFAMFRFKLPDWTISNCDKNSELLICNWNNGNIS